MNITTISEISMAKPDVAATESVGVPLPAADGLPAFRRAKPQDALDVAQATFVAEERVDMGALAERLGINRGTLYRWFGSRDQLMEQMLVRLAQAFSASAHAEAQWEGDERVLDFARRMMDATANFQPLRTFVEREPQLALRLLIGEQGAVHRSIAEALSAEVAKAHSARTAKELETRIDGVVRLAASLQWASIAIGEEPRIEELVDYIRAVLSASRATT